jgi:exodeoxyribonuclease VII small subunit
MSKEITYKSAVEELEQILADMENEEIGIDELSTKLKRATTLMDYCKARLRSTEEEVNKILSSLEENTDNEE